MSENAVELKVLHRHNIKLIVYPAVERCQLDIATPYMKCAYNFGNMNKIFLFLDCK